MKSPDNSYPSLIFRTRRFCKSLTSQDWFDFIILTFIAANCITLAVERPTIPPWSGTELVLIIEIHNTLPQVDREAYPECLQHNLHLCVHCRNGHEGCGQWVCVGAQQLLLWQLEQTGRNLSDHLTHWRHHHNFCRYSTSHLVTKAFITFSS